MMLVYAEVDADDTDCLGNEPVYDGDRLMGITTSGDVRAHGRQEPRVRLRRPGARRAGRPVRHPDHGQAMSGQGAGRTGVRPRQPGAAGLRRDDRRLATPTLGGRAGRIAEKARTVPVLERAVRPGLSGGAYRPLSDGDMQTVYDTALDLLEDVGMGSPIPEFVEVVTAAGGRVDEDGRLRYPRRVVEGAIQTAAKEFVWHGFDDDRSIEVGGEPRALRDGGRGRADARPRERAVPRVHLPRPLRRGAPRRHTRAHPLLRPNGRGPRIRRLPRCRSQHGVRDPDRHDQAGRHVVLPAAARVRGCRDVRPRAGRRGRVPQAAVRVRQQHLRRAATAFRRGVGRVHGRPGRDRHADQPAVGRTGGRDEPRGARRLAGPGVGRVPRRR